MAGTIHQQFDVFFVGYSSVDSCFKDRGGSEIIGRSAEGSDPTTMDFRGPMTVLRM